MPYLFYGDNTYLINKKLNEWVLKFKKTQFGDLNISYLEGESFTFEDYTKAISSLPFLGTKRLIIIKSFLLCKKEKDELLRKQVLESFPKIPETSIVLFVEEGIPDMRTSLFKTLNKPNFCFRLNLISPERLGPWIENKAREEGGNISPEARAKLQVFVGSDLWRMENEIKKLILFVKSQKRTAILPDDVEKMVKAENGANVFQFIDAVAQGDLKKSLLALHNLTDAGEEEFYIFSMIVYQFRNLFFVFELDSHGLTNQNIAKEARLHPFVITKNKSLLRYYSRDKLKRIYSKLLNIDRQIKTGALNPNLALPLLTAQICKSDA